MQDVELRKLKTRKVDTRSRSGWETNLAAQVALTHLPKGAVLEAIASEEDTKFYVELWAHRTGQEYLGAIPEPGYERIFVRRRQ